MKIAYVTAGAGGMLCGSCIRDNALARALGKRGHDVVLLPIYTPLDPLIEQYQLGWLAFLAKVAGFLFFYIWMRWTVPRYRYDQLMQFGWKWLFPASVLNLIVTAALVLYLNA